MHPRAPRDPPNGNTIYARAAAYFTFYAKYSPVTRSREFGVSPAINRMGARAREKMNDVIRPDVHVTRLREPSSNKIQILSSIFTLASESSSNSRRHFCVANVVDTHTHTQINTGQSNYFRGDSKCKNHPGHFLLLKNAECYPRVIICSRNLDSTAPGRSVREIELRFGQPGRKLPRGSFNPLFLIRRRLKH